MNCKLCGTDDRLFLFTAVDYITGSEHTLYTCPVCALVYVFPQPGPELLDACYPPVYYGEDPFLYEKIDAFSRFKKIKQLVSRGDNILDIGCGRGLVLAKLKKLGCAAYGTELSSTSARYAKTKLGLEIQEKDLTDCAYGDDFFNVVTMFHSLEHLIDPRKTLIEVSRILKPDGWLLIEVPDFGSIYARAFRSHWFHLDVPRHLFHFCEFSLAKLLNDTGFTIEKKVNHALMYDSFGALQSLLNVICSRQNLLNDLNTKRTNIKEIFMNGSNRMKIDFLISMMGQIFLYIPILGVTFFLSLFVSGGTLTFYARKHEM